jgi:PAS domain S-box-containing protein
MQLWLLFLGLATGLLIKLRRVLHRLSPLTDELHAEKVALAHIQSGVAWVRADGNFREVNPSFARAFDMTPADFVGRDWYKSFAPGDRERIRESYGQMLLGGMTSFEASVGRADGSSAWLNVRLVAVLDGKMRFLGHQCMIEDKTREHALEQQVHELEQSALVQDRLEREIMQRPAPADPSPAARITSPSALDALRRATGRSVISALNSPRKSTTPESVSPRAETR